jgi:hypothetical protein
VVLQCLGQSSGHAVMVLRPKLGRSTEVFVGAKEPAEGGTAEL